VNAHELKQLESRRTKLIAETKSYHADFVAVRKLYDDSNAALKEVEEKIAAARQHPMISEHAILRYAERVLGLVTDKIRHQLLTPETKAMINAVGSGKIPTGNGVKLVVKDKTVVTVLTT
jgi:hypothetical protein